VDESPVTSPTNAPPPLNDTGNAEIPRVKEPTMPAASVEAPPAVPPEVPLISGDERDKILDLFREKPLPAPTSADLARGGVLEEFFLKAHVHPPDWSMVRGSTAQNFIASALEGSVETRQSQTALTMLGRLLNEVGKEPYRIFPTEGETTEDFTKRVFVALAQVHAQHGGNTEKVTQILKAMTDLPFN
jgi:hypothetical protein